MTLLNILSHHTDPVMLKQIVAESGLHPSTTHRILNAMAHSGFVERAENGSYRLGIRLLELGSLVKSRLSLREIAVPFMLLLHNRTGESVNLGIRDADQIIYVERTSSGRSAIRVVHIVGARAPLHTTATGKLFLAEDDDRAVETYARRTGLPQVTPLSLPDLPQLLQALCTIRKDNIAYDLEEMEIGVRCIAAGIRNHEGELVAGLSLSAPAERFDPARSSLVRQTANDISKALGFTKEI